MSVCKHIRKDGICGLHSEPFYIEPCHEGPCTDYVAITNADKIRQMSDEELADFIERVAAEAISIFVIGNGRRTKTFFAWLDWLKQEMESE